MHALFNIKSVGIIYVYIGISLAYNELLHSMFASLGDVILISTIYHAAIRSVVIIRNYNDGWYAL